MSLALSGFPSCCGASILYGFSNDPSNAPRTFKTIYTEYPANVKGEYSWTQTQVKTEVYPYYKYEYVLKATGEKLKANSSGQLLDEKGQPIPMDQDDVFLMNLKARQNMQGGHGLVCIITQAQINNHPNWLEILKKNRFKFLFRFTNANHNDAQFLYCFGLVIDNNGKCEGEFFVPPKGWEDLDGKSFDEPKSVEPFQPVKRVVRKASTTGRRIVRRVKTAA